MQISQIQIQWTTTIPGGEYFRVIFFTNIQIIAEY